MGNKLPDSAVLHPGYSLDVAIGDLNERIAEKLEELEIDDLDVSPRFEK
jgi:type I restriction enzyme R subunit